MEKYNYVGKRRRYNQKIEKSNKSYYWLRTAEYSQRTELDCWGLICLSANIVEIWEILSNLVRVSPFPADTDTESLQSP